MLARTQNVTREKHRKDYKQPKTHKLKEVYKNNFFLSEFKNSKNEETPVISGDASGMCDKYISSCHINAS